MTQLPMPEGKVGSPISQLTEAITASSTRIYFDTSNLPTDVPNMCTISFGDDYETVWYTVKELTYIDVSERGFDGTTAQSWDIGSNVARYVCNYDFTSRSDNIIDHETRIGTLESAPSGDFIPKVTTPTTGNFPQLDTDGALVNSTYDETSFATAAHTHDFTDDFADIDHTHVYSTLTGIPGVFNLTWENITGDTTALANYCYVPVSGTRPIITLPVGAASGVVVGVVGYHNWRVLNSLGSKIYLPRIDGGASGVAYIDSDTMSDTIFLVCAGDDDWRVIVEGKNFATSLSTLAGVVLTNPTENQQVKFDASGNLVNFTPVAASSITRLDPVVSTIEIATTDAATGKDTAVDIGASYGLISRIRVRANFTAGQQTGSGTFTVNNASGISSSATTIAINNPSAGLTLAAGDVVRLDGEEILCGASTSTSSITNATRGYGGTQATYHDHAVQGYKLNDGLRLEIYPNSSRIASECLFRLSSIMSGSWTTDAAISAGTRVITLTGRPTNVSDFGEGSLILIDDDTDEIATVQDVYGDVADAATDDSIRTVEALAAHDITKPVYRIIQFDVPIPFKLTSGTTLYLRSVVDEKYTSTVTEVVELIVDKFA
jgi:hypothetical protein